MPFALAAAAAWNSASLGSVSTQGLLARPEGKAFTDMVYRAHLGTSVHAAWDQALLWSWSPNPFFLGSTGIRWNARPAMTDIHIKTEGLVRLLPFFFVNIRLGQFTDWYYQISETEFFAKANVDIDLGKHFGFFGSFGAYFRNPRLLSTLVPSWGGPLSNTDFIADIGFTAPLLTPLSFEAKAATFDRLAIYNLNNPYAQGTLLLKPTNQPWLAALFFRYQLLLGFGRLDQIVTGLNIRVW